MNPVRVRFAPSPTGHLHIGGLRTALFNWLFARNHGGIFLVRIEDTDLVRSQKVFEQSIIASLQWANLASDEPIVKQTDRMGLYKQKIEQLLQQGKAYRCYCATAPLETTEENYFKYDGRCRTRKTLPEDGHTSYVVRIKLPLEQKTIEFNDIIRGPIVFDINQLDDFIIARSDGSPIYNFVVVVDDADMAITHVIRGEDHISNTPKQIVLYQAFGFDIPYFAHLPLILGPTGARLSKRDAATAVTDYKNNGYLADALCNYLVRLGWSHGDQEIFTRQEMTALFSLEAVGKKGAIFDQDKLDWINSTYIKQHTPEQLLDYIINDVDQQFLSTMSGWDIKKVCALITLYQERAKTLREMVQDITAIYNQSYTIAAEDKQRWLTPKTLECLKQFMISLQALPEFTTDMISLCGKEIAKKEGVKFVEVAQPTRIALTGKANGPGVFELLVVLGKQESIERIEKFLAINHN